MSDDPKTVTEDQQTNQPQEEVVTEVEQPAESAAQTVSEPENLELSDTTSESVTEPEENSETPLDKESDAPVTVDQPEEESPTEEATKPTEETDTPKDEPAPVSTKSDVPGARWYVVHTYSGHENKVATTLKQRVESEHLENKILDVLVPVQDKIEIKGGKRVGIKEKIFPGYILVKMVLNDVSWLAVRTTQGVTSFVGMGNKPTPISDAEVQTIIKFTQNTEPVYKQVFMVDDTVKITDGPFAEFIGKVDSVDEEKGKVRVLVSIFGRETPVELDFLQVQKI